MTEDELLSLGWAIYIWSGRIVSDPEWAATEEFISFAVGFRPWFIGPHQRHAQDVANQVAARARTEHGL